MTFQLDTTGYVEAAPGMGRFGNVVWSDLSPFTQGYIEALFADFRKGDIGHWPDDLAKRIGFKDIAPETLGRIIADCEAKAAALACPLTAEDGRVFWRKFMCTTLTVQLGDDGKVRFSERG